VGSYLLPVFVYLFCFPDLLQAMLVPRDNLWGFLQLGFFTCKCPECFNSPNQNVLFCHCVVFCHLLIILSAPCDYFSANSYAHPPTATSVFHVSQQIDMASEHFAVSSPQLWNQLTAATRATCTDTPDCFRRPLKASLFP